MTEESNEIYRLRKTVDAMLARRLAAKAERKAASAAVDAAREHERAVKEATAVVQSVSEEVQRTAHRKVAALVCRSLEAVFDEPYEFEIVFCKKRGRTEADLVLKRDGRSVDPMTAAGGGVVDVAAFALRLSCLLLQRPPVRRLLVLDEPFKHLSRDYVGRARALLESLAVESGFQFVVVTHSEDLACGTVLRL